MRQSDNFGRDQRGTSTIELAIVAPLLGLMVVGVVDVSLAFSHKLRLQQAASRSIELATVGGLNSAAFASLDADAAEAAGVPIESAVSDKWLECDGARQKSFDDKCTGGAETARFAGITVSDHYVPIFGIPTVERSKEGYAITGKASVRVQ